MDDHGGCTKSCGESVQPLQGVKLLEWPCPRSWTVGHDFAELDCVYLKESLFEKGEEVMVPGRYGF